MDITDQSILGVLGKQSILGRLFKTMKILEFDMTDGSPLEQSLLQIASNSDVNTDDDLTLREQSLLANDLREEQTIYNSASSSDDNTNDRGVKDSNYLTTDWDIINKPITSDKQTIRL